MNLTTHSISNTSFISPFYIKQIQEFDWLIYLAVDQTYTVEQAGTVIQSYNTCASN